MCSLCLVRCYIAFDKFLKKKALTSIMAKSKGSCVRKDMQRMVVKNSDTAEPFQVIECVS